jgi:hypothetical protein
MLTIGNRHDLTVRYLSNKAIDATKCMFLKCGATFKYKESKTNR